MFPEVFCRIRCGHPEPSPVTFLCSAIPATMEAKNEAEISSGKTEETAGVEKASNGPTASSAAKGKGVEGRKHKSLLASLLNMKVMVVTFDGRTLEGTMRGSDQVCNIILEKAIERVFVAGQPAKEVELGLFVVRGDNVAIVGEVSAEKEAAVDWGSMRVS